MEAVIPLWQFILIIIFAVCFGFLVCSILSSGSQADDRIENSYWTQMAFIARSLMTEEQKKKLDKMMEEK